MKFGSCVVTACLLALLGAAEVGASGAGRARQAETGGADRRAPVRGLGPSLTAYMGFIDDEEAELRYHLDNDEISEAEYRVASARLAVTRAAALRIARDRKDDVVPELVVLQTEELTQVLPEGEAAVRNKRPGERLNDTWIYHGTSRRGVVFHVLERVKKIGRAPIL
jgi:hypothetical protein